MPRWRTTASQGKGPLLCFVMDLRRESPKLTRAGSFSPASNLSPHPTTPSTSPPTNPRVPNDTSLASDPFKGPTLLTINLAFEFSNPLHRIASQAVLPKVADKMVQAFERRCLEVYGRGTA
jgi:coenzyme Q-binding protein COQ10